MVKGGHRLLQAESGDDQGRNRMHSVLKEESGDEQFRVESGKR